MHFLLLALFLVLSLAHAYEVQIKKGELPATFDSMLERANADLGNVFSKDDFTLIESRELATSNYEMYVQTFKKVPVAATAIRIWKNKNSGELILGEMHLNPAMKGLGKLFGDKDDQMKEFFSEESEAKVQNAVLTEVSKHPIDSSIIGIDSQYMWLKGELVRLMKVRSTYGVHQFIFSLKKKRVIKQDYIEFLKSDQVLANVFPIYEEVEDTGELLPYEVRELRHLNSTVPKDVKNPFSKLAKNEFPENLNDNLKAQTEIGRSFNFWSKNTVRNLVEREIEKLPKRSNDFKSGLVFSGKYATVSIHPNAIEEFSGLEFPVQRSVDYVMTFKKFMDGFNVMKIVSAYQGRKAYSQNELLARIPYRLPDHNTISYMNSGFDEGQVYYAMTSFMESMIGLGFTDKELSEKPFHAFLYDPSINGRDNAFYYDDSIYFFTYGPKSVNLARHNPTIWHELGHGVMDRLMGNYMNFTDSDKGNSGLSEGMADFLSMLVIFDQMKGVPFPGDKSFRILNSTAFYLSNEFHDDGEAYGGVMFDMLQEVIKNEGRDGIKPFSDLILESMRLTRNHPSLSPKSWFEHIVYADEIGSNLRGPGKFKSIILQSLEKRNFSFDEKFAPTEIKLSLPDGEVLTNRSYGSRYRPYGQCGEDGVISFDLKLQIIPGDSDVIKFPATVKLDYAGGPLQGAVRWLDEEKGQTVYTLKSPADILSIPIKASIKCDEINDKLRNCLDYVYISVLSQGKLNPIGKKRFYLKVMDSNPCEEI